MKVALKKKDSGPCCPQTDTAKPRLAEIPASACQNVFSINTKELNFLLPAQSMAGIHFSRNRGTQYGPEQRNRII